MARFKPYVTIIGGASENYVVVCRSGYVGVMRKKKNSGSRREWWMNENMAPEMGPTFRDYVIIGYNKALQRNQMSRNGTKHRADLPNSTFRPV